MLVSDAPYYPKVSEAKKYEFMQKGILQSTSFKYCIEP